jgi:hypothetical protein
MGEIILTVLIYALKRAGKDIEIGTGENFKKKTISLCRWDAPLTHYDFESQRRLKKLDPQDEVEQFDVYEFPRKLGSQEKKLIINTLKERLWYLGSRRGLVER